MNLNRLFESVIREADESDFVDAVGYDENGELKTTRYKGSVQDAMRGATERNIDEDLCEKTFQIFKKACEEVAGFVDIDADDLCEYIGRYFDERDVFYYG